MNSTAPDRTSVRMSAALLLVGQLLYIVITQMHAGGEANNHPAIFAAYARSEIWTAVHVGQFAATAILLAGLFALPPRWMFRLAGRDGRLDSGPPRRSWRWGCSGWSWRLTGSRSSRP